MAAYYMHGPSCAQVEGVVAEVVWGMGNMCGGWAAYYLQVCLGPENGKDVTEGIRSSASTITSFPSSC